MKIKKLIKCVAFFLLCGLHLVYSAELRKIDIGAIPGGGVELHLDFDQAIADPPSYVIDKPVRIALDFPGVLNKTNIKNKEIALGPVQSITLAQGKDRLRLIIKLSAHQKYKTRVNGNRVVITLEEALANNSITNSAKMASQNGTAAKVAPQSTTLQNIKTPQSLSVHQDSEVIKFIEFTKRLESTGNVVISLSHPDMVAQVSEKHKKILVFFEGAQLPEFLQKRLDVRDFSTPVQFISSSNISKGVVISIELAGTYDYMAYQADKEFTVSAKPVSLDKKAEEKAKNFSFSGEKLSLNFQDIDVRSVLQIIADFTHLNLVASDSVSGNITLRLNEVPWDQALDLILKTKGLDQRTVGNVILVAPVNEIVARERQELEAKQLMTGLSPLRRELIQVNYAKAADIAKLFESITSAGESGTQSSSKSITVDERTNSIIAYQTEENLSELKEMVAQLDIPVRQVLIEARIVEADVGYEKELGVRWRGLRRDGNWVIGGEDGTGAAGTLVDLGASTPTSSFGIGFITDNTILDLELTAMENTGNGEVISQPKVVTSDKETARILKGTQIPYQEASSSGATATQFIEAALSLEVTPQITPDSQVIMDVKVNKDEPDFSNEVAGVPSIKTNEVNAKVLVRDGETIVIGGVFSTNQAKRVEKVPLLGDLPYLGQLFRNTLVIDDKSELLIFLTPRILNGAAVSLDR